MEKFYYETNKIVNKSDCFNLEYYQEAVNKIINDISLTEEEKQFLLILASRQIIFKYENLANYYDKAGEKIRTYLEELHAVVVDKDKAILRGYIKYQNDYNDYIKELTKSVSEE